MTKQENHLKEKDFKEAKIKEFEEVISQVLFSGKQLNIYENKKPTKEKKY